MKQIYGSQTSCSLRNGVTLTMVKHLFWMRDPSDQRNCKRGRRYTQHIGASVIEINGRKITFLDTHWT